MNKALEGLVALVGGIAAAVMPVTIDKAVNPAYAQNASPSTRDFGPCEYKGRQYNICIDQVYERATPKDDIYPNARLIPPTQEFMSRQTFLRYRPGEWEEYFFTRPNFGNFQNIFKTDPKIDFDRFLRLNQRLKGQIDYVFVFPEGYISIGFKGPSKGAYIIPISEATFTKVNAF
ncbi:hypothetical protein HYV81_02815 [Candidatus Woesearchaeota archaeon]|nr:hypothetical protein [Candidatus Woesearchaeota archaeon]